MCTFTASLRVSAVSFSFSIACMTCLAILEDGTFLLGVGCPCLGPFGGCFCSAMSAPSYDPWYPQGLCNALGGISSSFVVCQTRSFVWLCRRFYQRTPLYICSWPLTPLIRHGSRVWSPLWLPFCCRLSHAPFALFLPLRMTSPFFDLHS